MNPKRIDSNTHEIKAAFEELGWAVIDTHEVGKGFPDCVVAFVHFPISSEEPNYLVRLVEIKNGNAPYSKSEKEFMAKYPGLVKTVRSVEDVMEQFG